MHLLINHSPLSKASEYALSTAITIRMPVQALRTTSTAKVRLSHLPQANYVYKRLTYHQNGVGAFILQCKRLDFHYCDRWGSSKGMKYARVPHLLPEFSPYTFSNKYPSTFLRSHLLRAFAAAHPQIQIHISPRPNTHPIVRGLYINGREKVICVRNLEKEQILKKVELLRDANGEKVRRMKGGRVVGSLNESVRGVWDPFHGGNKEIVGDRIVGM